MFQGATRFNQDLDTWTPTTATSTNNMFNNAVLFDGKIFTTTASVNTMQSMFENAVSFTGKNIGDLDVVDVAAGGMTGMFKNAQAFNTAIGAWNVANTQTFASMFEGASSFNQPLDGWTLGANVVDG